MNQPTDSQLLRAYVENRSEAAFAELVRRHVDFVYSAALRMVCDPNLAEDVTQGVFVALAKSASQLTQRPGLSGWLHRTGQNLAAQTVRTIERRRAREQEAAAMNESLAPGPEDTWEHIAPHLDTALGELNEADRDALLLRYFERKSAREMADILGISDEAAQKRVSRAVERLRELFSKRKVTIGVSGLAILISANAVQSAPIGLAVTISAAALAGTAASTTTAIAATKTIVMTTLQKTIIGATLAVVAGTGIYEAHQASHLREQIQTLQQQQSPLADQIQKLQQERDDATNRLAGLLAENVRLESGSNETELLKLRSEAGMLRDELESVSQTNNPAAPRAVDTNLQSFLPAHEVEQIFTPASLKDSGLSTPEATIQTYLWTKLMAANPDSNAVATEKLRALSWFPPGFDPLKYRFAQDYPDPSIGVKFWRIDSVVYSAPDRADVEVGIYDDSDWKRGEVWNLVRDGPSWKVIAPVQ